MFGDASSITHSPQASGTGHSNGRRYMVTTVSGEDLLNSSLHSYHARRMRHGQHLAPEPKQQNMLPTASVCAEGLV